jgi:hypothetical protein
MLVVFTVKVKLKFCLSVCSTCFVHILMTKVWITELAYWGFYILLKRKSNMRKQNRLREIVGPLERWSPRSGKSGNLGKNDTVEKELDSDPGTLTLTLTLSQSGKAFLMWKIMHCTKWSLILISIKSKML